jgi:glucan phosphoethanolaminetransferase (alkaline phosphatase superfamily)
MQSRHYTAGVSSMFAVVDRPSKPPPSPTRKRRRIRRIRRLIGVVTVLAPMLWIIGGDLLRRGGNIVRLEKLHRLSYLGGIAECLVLWGLILYVAARRRGALAWIYRVAFVALFTLIMGIQAAFRSLWNLWLSYDAVLPCESFPRALTGDLPLLRPIVIFHIALATAVAVLLVQRARQFLRVGKWSQRVVAVLAIPAAYATTQIPASYHTIQASPPDAIYIHALTGLAKIRLGKTRTDGTVTVQRRSITPVPKLVAKPAKRRNVLLIVQESQRADVSTIAYDPNCTNPTPTPDPKCDKATRGTNVAAPDRYPLTQMRAVASSTFVSVATLWSGLRPTASRKLMHSAPYIWDYAHAAGYDTAYWSAQNVMFNNMRLLLQDSTIRHFATATNIDTAADFWVGVRDWVASGRAIEEWGALEEPFVAVVHYMNIHAPRVYHPRYAPFQPASRANPGPTNEAYKNYYKDVVYLSDLAVARLINHVRQTESGKRTVILFTADHGESYRERGSWKQGDHASTSFDEEIHVPTWIDAPPGTLSDDEAAAIKSKRDALLWHVDVCPTMLDLIGVWDDPAMTKFRAPMMGHPITRPELTTEPVPLSNVSWVWEYRGPNWGLMHGKKKIMAVRQDSQFECYDLATDPKEEKDLGVAGCPELTALGYQLFPVPPTKFGRLRNQARWGDPE